MVVTWKSRSSWISWMDERWPNVAMSKCAKGPSKPLWRWAEHGCLLSMASTTHHNYTPGTGSAYQTAHGSGFDWNDPNIQRPKQHSRLWKDMVKKKFLSSWNAKSLSDSLRSSSGFILAPRDVVGVTCGGSDAKLSASALKQQPATISKNKRHQSLILMECQLSYTSQARKRKPDYSCKEANIGRANPEWRMQYSKC